MPSMLRVVLPKQILFFENCADAISILGAKTCFAYKIVPRRFRMVSVPICFFLPNRFWSQTLVRWHGLFLRGGTDCFWGVARTVVLVNPPAFIARSKISSLQNKSSTLHQCSVPRHFFSNMFFFARTLSPQSAFVPSFVSHPCTSVEFQTQQCYREAAANASPLFYDQFYDHTTTIISIHCNVSWWWYSPTMHFSTWKIYSAKPINSTPPGSPQTNVSFRNVWDGRGDCSGLQHVEWRR